MANSTVTHRQHLAGDLSTQSHKKTINSQKTEKYVDTRSNGFVSII